MLPGTPEPCLDVLVLARQSGPRRLKLEDSLTSTFLFELANSIHRSICIISMHTMYDTHELFTSCNDNTVIANLIALFAKETTDFKRRSQEKKREK